VYGLDTNVGGPGGRLRGTFLLALYVVPSDGLAGYLDLTLAERARRAEYLLVKSAEKLVPLMAAKTLDQISVILAPLGPVTSLRDFRLLRTSLALGRLTPAFAGETQTDTAPHASASAAWTAHQGLTTVYDMRRPTNISHRGREIRVGIEVRKIYSHSGLPLK